MREIDGIPVSQIKGIPYARWERTMQAARRCRNLSDQFDVALAGFAEAVAVGDWRSADEIVGKTTRNFKRCPEDFREEYLRV